MKSESPARSGARPRHQSLIFKLFIVLLGAVGLTYFAFSGFYRSYWNTNARPEAIPNVLYYWQLTSSDIGNPPDTSRAAELSPKLGLPIALKGPGIDWHSQDFSPSIARELARSPDTLPVLLREGRIWAGIHRDGYLFMYGSRRRSVESLYTDWMALLPVLTLCCLLGWLTLRHMLRPLRELEEGVQAVAEGNLETRLSEKGSDELAGLGRSFNTMAQKLKDRERARDQLLLNVSHELRSPLTRMRVALEMASPSPLIHDIREEVEALGKMVSEILETERLKSPAGSLRPKPESLVDLLTLKVSRFEGQPPGIRWDPVVFPLVMMDLERMRLVIRNVIENALKYGADAGRPLEITLRQEDGFAALKIQDFGPGVAEEEQNLVFEPFYRLDRSRSKTAGYGLGLPLCRRIVEAHGGTISLTGKPGEGTTITIRLPLA